MRLQLERLLKERDLSVYALHQRVEKAISRSTLYRMVEKPTEASVSPAECRALCEALGVTPNELFGFREVA